MSSIRALEVRPNRPSRLLNAALAHAAHAHAAIVAAVALVVLAAAWGPTVFAEPPSVADFAWLAGDWVGAMDGSVIEELWTPAQAGTMVGMFRWSDEESVRLYELMSIEDSKTGPTLHLRHFSPGLKAWEEKDQPMTFTLDVAGDRQVSFVSITEKQTTRLTYRRTETGLEIALEQIEGAEKSDMTFVYRPRG